MPLPRKSTVNRSKTTATKAKPKKKATTAPRGCAKAGETLLLTCNTLIGKTSMEIIADSMFGMVLYDDLGRYMQVVDIRVDENAHKIYGRCKQVYEVAPFMFA